MNIGLTIKEVMTVKQGMIVTSFCNEYLPCAIITKETMNVGMTRQRMIVKEAKMIEEMNEEGMNGKE